MFQTLNHEPMPAWGLFIDSAEGSTSGLAPTRQAAIDAANKMATEHGSRIIYVEPEAVAGRSTVLQ
jgi:hypothetical protein